MRFEINKDREFWMLMRQALLLMVDAIERMLNVIPRTADLRKSERSANRELDP